MCHPASMSLPNMPFHLSTLSYHVTPSPIQSPYYPGLILDIHILCHSQSITVASKWTWWCLKLPAFGLFTQPFVLVQIKENIKALRHWPLWREFPSDWWIPQWLVNPPHAQRTSNTKNASIWWRYHVVIILQVSYVNSWTTLSSFYAIKWCIPAFNQTLSSCDWKLVTEVPRSQEKNSPKRQTKIQHKIHAQNQWY